MGVIEHADVIRAVDREKFDKRKFAREFEPHSDRNHLVTRAVKNCYARIWIESRHFRQICAIIIVFD